MEPTIQTGKNDTRRTVTWKQVSAAQNATMGRYAPLFSLVCASVQVVGAGSVELKGSNDGVTYTTLKDLAGDDLDLAAGDLVEFSSGVAFIKPEVTGGPADIIVTHWAG